MRQAGRCQRVVRAQGDDEITATEYPAKLSLFRYRHMGLAEFVRSTQSIPDP